MQRGQRSKEKTNVIQPTNERFKLGKINKILYYAGTVIYLLMFIANSYFWYSSKGEHGSLWLIITSLTLLVFHTTVLTLGKKAMDARNEREFVKAFKYETKAWLMLGFALGYIWTNSSVVLSMLLGGLIALLAYQAYKFFSFSPKSIFRSIALMIIINGFATIVFAQNGSSTPLIHVFSYLTYEKNGEIIFKITATFLLIGGLIKLVREYGMLVLLLKLLKYFYAILRGSFIFVRNGIIKTFEYFGIKKVEQHSSSIQRNVKNPVANGSTNQPQKVIDNEPKEPQTITNQVKPKQQNQPIKENTIDTNNEERPKLKQGKFFDDTKKTNTLLSVRMKESVRKIFKI